MEPLRGIEPRSVAYETAILPIELQRQASAPNHGAFFIFGAITPGPEFRGISRERGRRSPASGFQGSDPPLGHTSLKQSTKVDCAARTFPEQSAKADCATGTFPKQSAKADCATGTSAKQSAKLRQSGTSAKQSGKVDCATGTSAKQSGKVDCATGTSAKQSGKLHQPWGLLHCKV